MDSNAPFPTEAEGLPEVASPSTVRLRDGDRFALHITPVRKRIGDADVRMLAYNMSIPGPTLHVDQGSEITVQTTNDGDIETTVHWHGLRLENRSDGVPEETQAPIPIGGAYTCTVRFPDAGFYWYHPHLREDFAQEMGLYGTVIVEPSDPSYWPAADRQLSITLDDVLIEDGRMAPFHRSGPTFTAMGRFGNVFLINGETRFSGEAAAGEVVRLYLVNTANTRIFNVAVARARMKLIGGDSGRYEREAFVDEVLIAPSERVVVDVLFAEPGEASFEHRTPDRVYDLGAFSVAAAGAQQHAARSFDVLRVDPELTAERQSIAHDLDRAPDKVLAFVASMPLLYGGEHAAAAVYTCPMHPEVTATEAGRCPKCGMKLVPADVPSSHGAEARHDAEHSAHAGHGGHAGQDESSGIEWEDLMPQINRASDPSNMVWTLVDRATGAENHAIVWRFTVGDRVKIRLVNEMESDHPMHHPFHVHGAGRFLILSRDGTPQSNLVWKDTVLVRAGETVDILLDVTNPGRWMAHCHIAEHIESGMMFSFEVSPRASAGTFDGVGSAAGDARPVHAPGTGRHLAADVRPQVGEPDDSEHTRHGRQPMAQVTDPVCGMTIDSASAAGKSSYQGETYYFCSDSCQQQFEANPSRFVGATTGARREQDQRPEA
jgi:FtsP/CotA-like multicopper oxidase with cupredoxin domain/YHS domain-containing protein